jgi:hypothetical protein
MPPFDNSLSDAASPNNHDAAICATMRAYASRMRIGREDGQTKSVAAAFERCKCSRIARTRQSKACGNVSVPALKSSAFETLRHRLIGRRETFFQSEADIRGAGVALAKNRAGKTAQARTAARAAAIHAKQKDLFMHQCPVSELAYVAQLPMRAVMKGEGNCGTPH